MSIEEDRDRYLDEHANWSALRKSVAEEYDEADEVLRSAALRALTVLEDALGEDWPRRAYLRDEELGAFLGNRAAWTLRKLVAVAEQIKTMRAEPNWETVARRLRQPAESSAALFEMHVAALARSRGLHYTFDPPTRGAKRGDLKISPAREIDQPCIYVECTSQRPFPKITDDTGRMQWKLWPFFELGDWGLSAGGHLSRPVDDDELEALAERAHELYAKVRASGEPGEITVDDVLTLWAIPSNHTNIEAFIADRGGAVRGTISFTYDPFQRLTATIRKKDRQLPMDAASVVAIRPSRLVLEQPLQTVRMEVRKAVSDQPRVSAVALISRPWGKLTPRTVELGDDDRLALITLYPPIQEVVVLIWNPNRVSRLEDEMMSQLFIPDLGT
jgi:hypothetical protein